MPRDGELTLDGIYSKTQSINSALTQHFAEMITRLVSSGRDNNSSEVVLAGLRILDSEETNLPENLVLTEVRSAHLDLVEGRYRQVLRMFARSGFRVTSLHRSLFGALELGDLPPGQGRAVTADSI